MRADGVPGRIDFDEDQVIGVPDVRTLEPLQGVLPIVECRVDSGDAARVRFRFLQRREDGALFPRPAGEDRWCLTYEFG